MTNPEACIQPWPYPIQVYPWRHGTPTLYDQTVNSVEMGERLAAKRGGRPVVVFVDGRLPSRHYLPFGTGSVIIPNGIQTNRLLRPLAKAGEAFVLVGDCLPQAWLDKSAAQERRNHLSEGAVLVGSGGLGAGAGALVGKGVQRLRAPRQLEPSTNTGNQGVTRRRFLGGMVGGVLSVGAVYWFGSNRLRRKTKVDGSCASGTIGDDIRREALVMERNVWAICKLLSCREWADLRLVLGASHFVADLVEETQRGLENPRVFVERLLANEARYASRFPYAEGCRRLTDSIVNVATSGLYALKVDAADRVVLDLHTDWGTQGVEVHWGLLPPALAAALRGSDGVETGAKKYALGLLAELYRGRGLDDWYG